MVKECSGTNRVEGVAGVHVDVGTALGGRDVVADGETVAEYQGVTHWTAAAWKGRAPAVAARVASVSFFLTTASDAGYRYDQPVIAAFTEEGAVIAHPRLSGSLTTADPRQLKAGEPLELLLEFRCEARGVLAVTVNLPIADVGSVQWTLRKTCQAPTRGEVEERQVDDAEGIEKDREMGLSLHEGNQTQPIPGLNVGFSRTAHGQMWDGVVNKDFRLRESSNELAICPANRHFLTFYLYQNASVKGAVDVAYGKPELITTSDVSAPILSGSMEGGVVNASQHASFTITFHCHSDGETMYTLTIPLLPLPPSSMPPRSAIVLSFLKSCNMSSSGGGVEMGGLGIQGFSIGRTEGAFDVVRDGFPTPHYFGQKVSPLCAHARLHRFSLHVPSPSHHLYALPLPVRRTRTSPTGTTSSCLSRSCPPPSTSPMPAATTSASPPSPSNPPILVSHSSLFKPVLSGRALDGGHLRKNAKTLPPGHHVELQVPGPGHHQPPRARRRGPDHLHHPQAVRRQARALRHRAQGPHGGTDTGG